jgi:pimeloyl-ACP methyl ester carboxylesterase
MSGEAGPALILIHSGFLDSRMWEPQMERFSEGFTVIRYDARGYGRSTAANEEYSDADDLLRLFEYLGRVFLLGNSNGARIACEFAAGLPDRIHGLILVSGTPADLDPTEEEQARFLDTIPNPIQHVLDLNREGRTTDSIEASLELWAPRVDVATRARLRPIASDNHRQLVALTSGKVPHRPPGYPVADKLQSSGIPILLLCGDHDHPALAMMMGRFAQRIPTAKYVVLKGGDHSGNISSQQEFDFAVRDFLSRVRSGTWPPTGIH